MRILVAEDDPALLKSLLALFEHNKFTADGVSNGTDALSFAQTGEYDGLVLDIVMPGLDGISVLRRLREMGFTMPVLLLSALTEVAQRVEGLDAGADDYLTKPFAVSELLARVRAMLRRKDNFVPEALTYHEVTLNRAAYRLEFDGRVRGLSGKEYQILELLMQNPGAIVPTDRFMTHIWGWDSEVDTGSLWVHISNIRKKLEALGTPVEIKFVRGAGYMLEDQK